MSLRARLLAAFAYALLVVIVALMVPLATNLGDRVNAEVEADSAAQAQVVAASVADQMDRPGRLQDVSADASAQLGGRVFIVDGRGRLLADSSGESELGTSIFAEEEHPPLRDALNGDIGQGSHPPDLDVLSTAVPIVRSQRTIGALEVEQSIESVNEEIRSDVAALAGIGVLALALGLGVAWILAGSIARPLHVLAGASRRMAGGDLRARAPESGSTEQVELARAFNDMADRLGALLESQRAFVADASHQLRTPLTGLRLRLEAAESKAGEEAVADLAAAEREIERLSAVVSDLLALAASEDEPTDERADLGAAAQAAAGRWRDPADSSGHELLVAGDGRLTVTAGEADLALILDNLVENALKYSPRGSAVEIEWERRDGAAALQVLSASGPLSEEERARAFERFFRGASSPRRPGTGLGLSIVKALARRAGGRARLENVSEDRVVAEVLLPLDDSVSRDDEPGPPR
ncbi:MAG TPA: HAMP domain-containing sensor histidine kinase [Solirubrobacterales bacterium]|jgi:signal transduction histidine kinase|nr:HAMP domain-containing sensor histidine kinase [Solirubrobacterales bacterium]